MSNDRNLLVMKASAGSGKTYNLALQYINHLLFTYTPDGYRVPRRRQGADGILNAHRQLLAITFTNKATDEMKDRIVKELYRLAQEGVHSDYLSVFVQEPDLDEARVRSLARQALHELLFDYSNFNVSTIDSFFQTILRTFARELDRDFNYDIQLEEKYAVRVALHNFLLSLGQKGEPTQVDLWVREYLRHMTHGDPNKRRWKFFDDGGDLLEFAKQINSEMFRSRMDDIRDYLGHADGDGEFHSDFSKIRAFKQLVHQVVKDLEDRMTQNDERLLGELQAVSDSLKGNSALSNVLKNGGFKNDTLKGANREKIADQFKKASPIAIEAVDRITALVGSHFTDKASATFFKTVENNLGLLGMLAMIDVYLERYRHETNSILIGDTNELIGTVLESGSDFVYERVGTTISHFMIDEFQDMSTKQYENFRGLLRESLANGNFNMLIGDAKQSIYRFRNADPSVFRERVEEDFKNDIHQPPVEPGKPQSVNYRSSLNIIEFNNMLFEFASTRYPTIPAVARTYKDVRQGTPNNITENKVPGYVRVLTGNYKHLLDDRMISDIVAQENIEVEPDREVKVLTVLPAYLLQLHERYDWSRIGILVNSNNHGNQVVERILDYNRHASKPISIISGESLLISNSSVVRRIIALLRFIDISQSDAEEETDGDTTPAEADKDGRRWLQKRLSDQRLYAGLSRFIHELTVHPETSPQEVGTLLDACLEQKGQPQSDNILLDLLPDDNELSTLVSIVENIIAYFKRDHAASADVDREAAFLLAFQDTVQQFSSMRNGGSVREFLKFWDEKKDTLTVNASATTDAINIMTIHKAKGLEFDCVVIPFANWELDTNSQELSYWMPSEAFADVFKTMAPDGLTCDNDCVPPLLNVPKGVLVDAFEAGKLQDHAHDFVEEQLTAVVLDNLNKTYVALTRPRTELHLFVDEGRNNQVKPLLQDFAQSNDKVRPILDDDGGETGWFEYGEISTRAEIDSKRSEDPVTTRQVEMNRYPVTAIPVDVRVRVEHASGSRIDAGVRIHSLLSEIGDSRDVDRVIDQAIKHGSVTDAPDDRCNIQVVNDHVRGPIMDASSRVSRWFDPANKVYSERTITTAAEPSIWNDGGIENLRPDRIVRRPDGKIIVIDYKSGERNDKKYCRQVQRYVDKLRLVFPGVAVSGRIWYVTLDVIIDEKGHELKLGPGI